MPSEAVTSEAMPSEAWDVPWLHDRLGTVADVRRLRSNESLTDAIWRVSGPTGSIVVKRLTRSPDPDGDQLTGHWTARSDEPTHWNYWRREYLFYSSDVPAHFAAHGVHAPALLHAVESPDAVTMFIEDCRSTPAPEWAPDSYVAAARDLGAAQGASTQAPPSPPWLARNYLRDYASEKPFDRRLVHDDTAWGAVPGRTVVDRDALTRFTLDEARLLAAAESAPQTLCHNDFWTRNLFGDAGEPTTAIDWAFTGPGPMGADVANLVASAGFDAFVPARELAAFGDEVFAAYLDGLRDSGWRGERDRVRIGYLASFVKYGWVVPALLVSAARPEHPVFVGYGTGGQLDFDVVAATLRVLAGWARQALGASDEQGKP